MLGISEKTAVAALACMAAMAAPDERWVYVNNGLGSPEEEARLVEIVNRAADAGYNAVNLACGIERCGSWDAERKERFSRVKALCDRRGLEIIPSLWSIGYGSPLWHDFNLAEGQAVEGVRFRADLPFADFVPDAPGNLLENGGFETPAAGKDRIPGWTFIDNPGEIAFRDTGTWHSGEASLRMENFAAHPARNGRACATAKVSPHRQYRFEAWVRTKDLAPSNAFRALALGADDVCLGADSFEEHGPTEDWRRFTMLFNSGDCTEVRIYAGVWDAEGGTYWIDDAALVELGLVEPLRRPGTPFVVRDAKGRPLEEGVDYEAIRGVRFGARIDTVSQRIRLLPGGRAHDGDMLTVDYYHPARIEHGQISVCMSEPALYDYFRRTARDVQALCAPRRWFLDLDEIRAGGTCAACAARGTDMAHILADCVREMFAAVRAVNPSAELWAWNDMFDPHHNARDSYYRCKGTFAGAGDLVPKELGIACWNGQTRVDSLSFFAARGHRTLAAGYYDADDLAGDRAWLDACRKTPECVGMMYTTWENKYGLLEDFARLK